MARLPVPGSDEGTWGQVLNTYLSVVHNTDGSLKDNVVTGTNIAPNSVDNNIIQNASIIPAHLNSDTPANGEVLSYSSGSFEWVAAGTGDPALGGDLSGTAGNAQIVNGAVGNGELATDAVTDVKVAASAAIAQSKIANLTSDLAGKASTTHAHAAADITSGTIATARLGSGTANSTSYLRGDSTWVTPAIGSPEHLTVASADAPQAVKDACDYVCTGTNDQTIINQALLRASRPGDGFGGEGHIGVCLVGPNFYIGNNNSTSITMYPSTHLYGMGPGTLLQPQFTTVNIDRGVIELLNSNTAHVFVSNLSIARTNAVKWYGHGIKFNGAGNGDTYEIKSGNDPFNRIENVWVGYSRNKGVWITGTSGGSRETQIMHCVFYACDEQGLLIDGSSDSQISDCRANGGNSYPRFEIGGGNTKIANCKAYYAGNGTVDGDGFLISSSRCEIANCAAQDNGRWGFRFEGTDVTASGLAADSNSRTQSDGGAFLITTNGVYEGLHAFDRNQTPASRQLRGVVFSGTPDVYLSGRMSVPSGTDEVVGSPSVDSFARVVRSSGGVYSVG
ncbi:MAG TPA: hypothetical protein PK096_01845 [Candidatus Saccharibacteria bacterium]|nr:hypothetical protein [Candidatus Saccharibacteria bacterium]HRK94089.1 hypothetical protein [Candidatus Saccharibacteria bacterium]